MCKYKASVYVRQHNVSAKPQRATLRPRGLVWNRDNLERAKGVVWRASARTEGKKVCWRCVITCDSYKTRRSRSFVRLYSLSKFAPLHEKRSTMMTNGSPPSILPQLYVQTPLLRSRKLSEMVGADVWLKMETVQTSGSFKSRGLSNFAKKVSYTVRSMLSIMCVCYSCRLWLEVAQNLPALQVCYSCTLSPHPSLYDLSLTAGGNAGLAAAFIARELGLPITVVIPETTPSFIADKLREEGASVEVVGKVRA